MEQHSTKRVIGRRLAKELAPEELDLVSAGDDPNPTLAPPTRYTEITGDKRASDEILD